MDGPFDGKEFVVPSIPIGKIRQGGGGGATTFTGLTDVPNSYVGQALKVVQVNAGETALQFVTISGGGDALTANPLSQFAASTSLQLKGVITDETGGGKLVFGTSPELTTPTITTSIVATTDDGATLGDTTHNFSDLFLASGAVINYANGNAVITHSSGIITVSTGDLRVTTAGTNAASAVTVGGTQTLTNKTLTAPTLTTPSLGVAIATTINKVTITTPATGSTLTIDDGFTLHVTGNVTAFSGSSTGSNTGDQTSVSGNAGTATALQTARTIGGVSFDGTANIVPATITIANEATDTSCFPLFATAATGDLGPKSNAALTFNSNTGALASTLFAADTITANVAFVPDANDGAALGTTALQFSDLFLAEGAVINFDNGDATITQTNNDITIAGITTFGVGTSTAVTLGTIELGAASDTTIARVSAGVVSIEGVNILTVAGGTLTGAITLGENTSIALDPAGSADGKYTGITIAATAGYTQAFGDVVYLDPTDSRWEKCDANSAAGADGDSRGTVGMVVSAGTDGNPCVILLQGVIRADAAFPTFTINNPVYISETAGAVTQTQPTTTDVVIRVIGFALTADEFFFSPSSDYITHT